MSEHLEFTGERFTPECEREIWYEHVHRYAFASGLCAGLEVLDAACGEGYGAAMLARTARRVTGVDVTESAIAHAQGRYGKQPNLEFRTADCSRLPFRDQSFDCVVSFETIEHLDQQEQVLVEFRRVLRPTGFLLMSSPDKAVYSDARGMDNPFHVRELYRGEFEALLAGQFPAFRLLGQKLLFHSAIWSLDGGDGVLLQTMQDGMARTTAQVPHAAMYLLAVAAASEDCLPVLDRGLWLFDDAGESVYSHYLGEIRRNMKAGGIIAARDAEIAALREAAGAHRERRTSWLGRLFKR